MCPSCYIPTVSALLFVSLPCAFWQRSASMMRAPRVACNAQVDIVPFPSVSTLVWEDDFMGVESVVLVSPFLRQTWLNSPIFPLPTTNVTLCLFADTLSWILNYFCCHSLLAECQKVAEHELQMLWFCFVWSLLKVTCLAPKQSPRSS